MCSSPTMPDVNIRQVICNVTLAPIFSHSTSNWWMLVKHVQVIWGIYQSGNQGRRYRTQVTISTPVKYQYISPTTAQYTHSVNTCTCTHIPQGCYTCSYIPQGCYTCSYIPQGCHTCPHIPQGCYTCPHIPQGCYTCPHIPQGCHTCPHIPQGCYTCPHIPQGCYTCPHIPQGCYTCPYRPSSKHDLKI